MLFFKRILKEPEPVAEKAGAPPVAGPERRSTRRYAIHPGFPLQAVLCLVGRDDTGAPMSNTRHGWNWKGRLIDCSERGVRIQMGPVIKGEAGDPCDLKLSVDDFELTVPCLIANLTERPEGMVFGLSHAIEDATTLAAYRQLLEVVALGSTLKSHGRGAKRDESGYLVQHFVNDRPARLSVWRHPADSSVSAFEFLLQDNLVRAVAGQGIQYLSGESGRSVAAARSMEIQRLFRWVVPNLAPVVPEDVRVFMKRYSA
jgi:hypothetical protein